MKAADGGPARRRRTYFPALDGIRAIAVMIVVFAHGSERLWPEGASFSSGWVGVQLFFVLSGFLITYLLLVERQATGRISLKDFYIRRTLRIWPLYFAMLSLYAFVLPRLNPTSFSGTLVGIESPGWEAYRSSLWPHAVFLQNYLVRFVDVKLGLGVYWSLAVEEHFYLAWPLVVLIAPRKLLPWILGVGATASAAFSLGYDLRILTPLAGHGKMTHTNVFPIAVGALIGYWWVYQSERTTEIGRRTLRAAVVAAWLTVTAVVVDGWELVTLNLVPGPQTAAKSLVVVAAAVLIVAIIVQPADQGSWLLSHPHMVHVGRISYGIYLTHVLVLGVLARSLSLWRANPLAAMAATVLFSWLAIAVADLIYRRFEAPILRLKNGFQRF